MSSEPTFYSLSDPLIQFIVCKGNINKQYQYHLKHQYINYKMNQAHCRRYFGRKI